MKKTNSTHRSARRHAETTAPKKLLPDIFDIPGSSLPGLSHIELSGNREALVGNCQGVLEYNEDIIKLSTGKMVIKFTGRNLQIKVLTHDSAIVSGFITDIGFIT